MPGDITVNAKITGDSSSFQESVDAANQSAKELGTNAEEMTQSLSGVDKDLQGVGQAGSDASGGLDAVGKSAKNAEDGMGGISESANKSEEGLQNLGQGMQAVGQESEKAGTSLRTVGRSTEESGRGFMSMAGEAMQVVQNIAQMVQVVGQVIGALDKSVEAAQHTQVAFATLTGGAVYANQALADLQNTAAAKTYGTQQIDDAAQHLLMMGKTSDQAKQEVQRLADGFASVGQGAQNMIPVENALDNISKKSKITTQDMQALVDQGLPAWQALASGMGTSVDDAIRRVNAGAVSGKVAMDDIMKGLDKQAGASEDAGKQLSSQWTKLGEDMSKAFGPFIQDLADIVHSLDDFVQAGMKVEQALKGMEEQSKLLATDLEFIRTILNQMAPGGGSLIPSMGTSGNFGPGGFASGGTDLPSGWRVVGEEGPELQWSPGGDTILPNSAFSSGGSSSRSSLSSGGGGLSSLGGSGTMTIYLTSTINLDGRVLAQQTIPHIAPMIRNLTGRRS